MWRATAGAAGANTFTLADRLEILVGLASFTGCIVAVDKLFLSRSRWR